MRVQPATHLHSAEHRALVLRLLGDNPIDELDRVLSAASPRFRRRFFERLREIAHHGSGPHAIALALACTADEVVR